ncbi:MAG: hypothetical protein GX592_07205 [Clostridiales bacterium]|nr:hypothetical protein [Clostridiales bacterium]
MNEDTKLILNKLDAMQERINAGFENIEGRLTKMAVDIKSTGTYAEQAALFAGDLFDRVIAETDERLKKLEAN